MSGRLAAISGTASRLYADGKTRMSLRSSGLLALEVAAFDVRVVRLA